MYTETLPINALTISLFSLASVRFLGMAVFLDLLVKQRTPKHLLLFLGWLTVTAGSGWVLYTHLVWGDLEPHFFSLLSGLGNFWISCGLLAYFNELDEKFKTINRSFVVTGSLIIIIYGLLPLFGLILGSSPNVLVQLFVTLIVIYTTVFKRQAFLKLSTSSYNWLVTLAVLSSALTLAFGFGLIDPQNLALGFTGVTVVQFVAIIFFLHLEFNLTNRQLESSQQRFMRLAENAQDLIYHYDLTPKRGFSYVSPAALSITGYTPEEFYADPNLGFKLVHPEDRPILRAFADMEDQLKDNLTIRWLKKDGCVIWCEQRNVPIYDKQGNLVAIEGIARDITSERKTALQYQQLFNQMQEGFALHEIILDDQKNPIDYRFLSINPAFERLTGLVAEEIIGRTVLEVLPDTEPYWIETYGQVALTGEPAHLTNLSQKLGKHYEVNAFQPTPKQFATIVSDVTEEKHSERVQQSIYKISQTAITTKNPENFYRYIHTTLSEIVNAENFYIALYNPTSECLAFPYFVDQFDKAPPTLKPDCGLTGYVLQTGKPLLATPEIFDQLVQQGKVEAIGADSVDWLGVPLIVEENTIGVMAVQSYSDEFRYQQKDLKLLEFVSSQIALTIERKQAEQALHHSHELLRYIIEHSNSAVAIHDRDLNYIYVSQLYLDDYHVNDKNIIGKHHYEVFPNLPQKWRDAHQKALAGEVTSAEEDSYEKSDGSVAWTRWECRPWYEANGEIGGIIVYTEVITKRKQVEEKLRQFKADLEIQVEEKTQELQQRVAELERFHDATIQREFRIKELREEIKKLRTAEEEKSLDR